MNLSYILTFSSKPEHPQREIDLHLGQNVYKSKIGCLETLFLINEENQIQKMECMFYLGLPVQTLNFGIYHPQLFYIDLPSDLLNLSEAYEHTMQLTDADSILKISRFSGYFGYSYDKKDVKVIDCHRIYETIELPTVRKFRGRHMIPALQGEYLMSGLFFHFSTTVSDILHNIVYNNVFNQSTIGQFHQGSGDNVRRV